MQRPPHIATQKRAVRRERHAVGFSRQAEKIGDDDGFTQRATIHGIGKQRALERVDDEQGSTISRKLHAVRNAEPTRDACRLVRVSERAWKIAPRVARMPRCIMPTQSPPCASTVMSLKRQPASIAAAGPALISPVDGDSAEAIVERSGKRSIGKCGERPHRRRCRDRLEIAVRVRRSTVDVRPDRSNARDPSCHAGDSPITAFGVADQPHAGQRASAMTHLVQRAEAAQTRCREIRSTRSTRLQREARSHTDGRALDCRSAG